MLTEVYLSGECAKKEGQLPFVNFGCGKEDVEECIGHTLKSPSGSSCKLQGGT